jgi:hypothetical protein
MWMIFNTEPEAQAYCDEATATLPNNPGDVTLVWDTPRALADGRFVVSAFGEGGQEWGDDWALPEPEHNPNLIGENNGK